MCGRTACTLAPDEIAAACTYKDANGNQRMPKWASVSLKHDKYQPSPNIGPKCFTPVLVSPRRFNKSFDIEDVEDRIICEMQWGLIPSWHKGTEGSFKFNMINCRSDTLLEKASFKGPLERGQRCVVLVDGFYEWQTTKIGRKQPYFLQFVEDTEASRVKDEPKNVEGEKRLLTMAALYDKWYATDSKEPLYSYSIITVAASDPLKWLHHRMPAILESDEEIQRWLDPGSEPSSKAFSLIRPTTCLQWYPVSTTVNSVRNKSAECMQKIDVDASRKETGESGSSKIMNAWIRRSPKKLAESKPDCKIQEKICKLE